MATGFTEINLSDETREYEINGTPVVDPPQVLFECETCGAAVANPSKHDLWHVNQEIHGLR